ASNPALQSKLRADLVKNDQEAAALGRTGQAAIAGYTASLPADGGSAAPVDQPRGVTRFDSTFFTWNGGDNFTDNPTVVVQRRDTAGWTDYADQSGEVPVTLKFPVSQTKGGSPSDLADYATGRYDWLWTADFEAYVSWFAPSDRPQATPPGDYRFLIRGVRRQGSPPHPVPYELTSHPFRVLPWGGVTVEGLHTVGSTVSFKVGPTHALTGTDSGGGNPITSSVGPIDYPDTYPSDAYHTANKARFIQLKRTYARDPSSGAMEWFCFTCTFRPWLDAADASRAYVSFLAPSGRISKVPAVERNGWWVASQPLPTGSTAYVAPGDVCDAWGDYNAVGAGGGPPRDAGMPCVPPAAKRPLGG